jgi:hypothetical protein
VLTLAAIALRSFIHNSTDNQPAPGWEWGCRFSYKYLENEIMNRRYEVIARDRNILLGNDRPEDKGSAYFLFRK